MNMAQRTVGELVTEDYRRASVFKKHGIDFCCGGGKTLRAACEKKGVSLDEMSRALEAAEQRGGTTSMRPATWSPDFLADYIVNEHHTYVRESIPLLQEFLHKVARVHGTANPEVVDIARRFDEVASELRQHMVKEEDVLFPYVKALVAAKKSGQAPDPPAFGTVRNPIRMMEHEHDAAGDAMREIRRLSGEYTPPEHACTTYRVTYAKLEEFEGDLHRHVHLENNVLFPGAVALEEEWTAQQEAGSVGA